MMWHMNSLRVNHEMSWRGKEIINSDKAGPFFCSSFEGVFNFALFNVRIEPTSPFHFHKGLSSNLSK